jgi:hypothetical protein
MINHFFLSLPMTDSILPATSISPTATIDREVIPCAYSVSMNNTTTVTTISPGIYVCLYMYVYIYIYSNLYLLLLIQYLSICSPIKEIRFD